MNMKMLNWFKCNQKRKCSNWYLILKVFIFQIFFRILLDFYANRRLLRERVWISILRIWALAIETPQIGRIFFFNPVLFLINLSWIKSSPVSLQTQPNVTSTTKTESLDEVNEVRMRGRKLMACQFHFQPHNEKLFQMTFLSALHLNKEIPKEVAFWRLIFYQHDKNATIIC